MAWLLRGALAAVAVAGGPIAFVVLLGGALVALSEWPTYSYSSPFARFGIEGLLRAWFYGFSAVLAVAICAFLGYRGLVPAAEELPHGRRHGLARHAPGVIAVLAAALLIAAAVPSHLATPSQTRLLTDEDFPVSTAGAGNSTYRQTNPMQESAGVFLDGAFYARWSVLPGYGEWVTPLIAALDANGTKITPADFLYHYQIPRAGDYVVIVDVPAVPSGCETSPICQGTDFGVPKVDGNLTAVDPRVYPPVQDALEALGIAVLGAVVGIVLVDRRRKRVRRTAVPVDVLLER